MTKPAFTLETEYTNPIRTNYHEKFIKVLICYNFEVEISAVAKYNKYFVNIYISPNIELEYKKSNGVAWQFDNVEEAWDFIDATDEFNLRFILIEFEKEFAELKFNGEKNSEYHYCYHKLMNVREALGVFRTYVEIVNQSRTHSLTLNAKLKYCQDSFGGYGYYYNFTTFNDRYTNYINFSSKDVSMFVDLNLNVSQIVKSFNLIIVNEVSKAELKKAKETKIDQLLTEQEVSRINRIQTLEGFITFLEHYI